MRGRRPRSLVAPQPGFHGSLFVVPEAAGPGWPCSPGHGRSGSPRALPPRGSLQLGPQPGNVHVDGPCLQSLRPMPQTRVSSSSRDTARLRWATRKPGWRVSVSDSSPRSCSDQRISRRSKSIDGRAEPAPWTSPGRSTERPQHRLDAGQQFPGGERLDDIIVRAHFQAADAVVLGAAGREDDDREGSAGSCAVRSALPGRPLGQQQVEQDQVDAEPDRLLQSLYAVGGLGHFVAGRRARRRTTPRRIGRPHPRRPRSRVWVMANGFRPLAASRCSTQNRKRRNPITPES